MATRPDYPLLTAEEFLQIEFGERKAELDDGVVRMMAGGTARHARVQGIVFVDIATERVRVVQRTGRNSWTEQGFDDPADVALPTLGVILPHEDIFARD